MLLAGSNKLHARRNKSQAGFTLVEMMTVLVIIGLMSSAVILTLPQNKSALEIQSQALLRGTNTMAQSGLIAGTPVALGFSENEYAFMTFENGKWEIAQSFEFMDGVQTRLQKNNVDIKFSDEIIPLVLFEPNGLSTPFKLRFSDLEDILVLQSLGDGRVQQSNES